MVLAAKYVQTRTGRSPMEMDDLATAVGKHQTHYFLLGFITEAAFKLGISTSLYHDYLGSECGMKVF